MVGGGSWWEKGCGGGGNPIKNLFEKVLL